MSHPLRYAEDTETGEVVVGLNPQLTSAVLAQNGYLRLDFEEVRKLKGDPARLIHSRLHWINQGARRVLLLSTLCEYVYGDKPVSPSGEANRKAAVREGLAELEGLGWSIRKMGTEHYEIARPAQPPSAYAQRRRESTGRTVKPSLVERRLGLTVTARTFEPAVQGATQ